MATSKKTIEFSAKNVKAFTEWLKKFSLITNSLLLEIDQAKSSFIAKSYNEERSVVKMSTIKFDDAGLLVVKANKDPKRVKAGIYNIPRLIKIMDQFNDVEFTFTIEYQEIISESDTQYAAEKLLFKNNLLKMNVDCASLNIFKYISDSLFKDDIATITLIGTFELAKCDIEKISTLNNLDSEDSFMEFKLKDGKTYISGKSYDLLIEGNKVDADAELTIFKEQYAAVDIEGYDIKLGEKLVFTSKDSDTVTVISRTEGR